MKIVTLMIQFYQEKEDFLEQFIFPAESLYILGNRKYLLVVCSHSWAICEFNSLCFRVQNRKIHYITHTYSLSGFLSVSHTLLKQGSLCAKKRSALITSNNFPLLQNWSWIFSTDLHRKDINIFFPSRDEVEMKDMRISSVSMRWVFICVGFNKDSD